MSILIQTAPGELAHLRGGTSTNLVATATSITGRLLGQSFHFWLQKIPSLRWPAASPVAAAPATAATAAAPRLVRAGGLHAPTRWVPAARVADRGPEGQRSARGAAQRLAAAQQLQQPPARGRRPVRPKPALHTRHMGSTWASRCSRGILGCAEALERCSSCAFHRLNLLPNCER